jgi:glyoxylase-like metal-dependent hydrolase (beta-lactamase superfamily II)
MRDDAVKAPIKVHKLRGNVNILEGSGGNIAVLIGGDGKVFVDAGITASRPRILEAANHLSRDPIKHLINSHWHFDHADGNGHSAWPAPSGSLDYAVSLDGQPCVVVALPGRTWPVVRPSTHVRRLHHQSLGLNT